jgi:hypothetical protein
MHDVRLEDQLRSTLRAEGDGLPFTITPDELERRQALRRRERAGRRMTLLAAGIAVVAIGSIAAIGGGWLRLPAVGVDPTEVPSTVAPSGDQTSAPTSSVTPDSSPISGLPDFTPPLGEMLVDVTVVDGEPGQDVPMRAGGVPSRAEYRLAMACVGRDSARWSIGQEGEADFVIRGDVPCDGTVAYTDIEVGTPPFETIVWVTTDSGNDWHLQVASPVGPPDFIAPLLAVTSAQSLDGVAGTGLATCASRVGNGASCTVPYFARDGAAEVSVPTGASLVFALADGWTFESTRFEAVRRAEARVDPLAPIATPLGSRDGGPSLEVALDTLAAGEWLVRAVVNGSRGDDAFGGAYDVPVIIAD